MYKRQLNRGIVTVYENNDASNEIIIDGGIADVTPQGCSILVERAEIVKSLDKNEIEKKYQFHKDKENSFENPIEEKANNDELKWLEFVLEQVKN